MPVERHEHSRRLEFMQRRRGVFDLLPVLAVVVFVGFDKNAAPQPGHADPGMEVGERGGPEQRQPHRLGAEVRRLRRETGSHGCVQRIGADEIQSHIGKRGRTVPGRLGSGR